MAATGILVSFYEGATADNRGRWLREIQSWDFGRLEESHDYIQWLFPLKKRSTFNSSAPTLDSETISAFQSRPELKARLIGSMEVLLRFYGFKLQGTPDDPQVTRSEQWILRAANWMTPGNHNHLRITRILGCLRILGCRSHAEEFFRALQEVYWSDFQERTRAISDETFSFWRSAAGLSRT